MKIILFAVVAVSLVSPAFAAESVVNTKPQVFLKDSQKRVDGVTHIRAVSKDGKRVAKVRVEKDGSVVGEVEGKKVNVSFDGI
jgi:opacity protein-like surface antigen